MADASGRESTTRQADLAGADSQPLTRLLSLSDQATVPPDAGTALPGSGPVIFADGRFVITGRVGAGGMGLVFRAEQQSPARTVALKILPHAHLAGQTAYARFLREVDAIARLSHPFIVPVYESGNTDDQIPYYTMELVEGKPLDEYANDSDLSVTERLQLIVRVCQGVQAAHQRAVIHRDLKPSNILVDTEGNPRILDFGLAKILVEEERPSQDGLDLTHGVIGTPAYMAPEQTLDAPDQIDTRTDVYALGVILYNLLTDSFPYPVDGPIADVLQAIRHAPPTRPRRSNRRLPTDLEAICLRALEKDRERRYQSPQALADDLEAFLDDRPVSARLPTAGYRFGKLVARNKLLFSVLLAVALTVAEVAWLALWGVRGALHEAEMERDRAALAEQQLLPYKQEAIRLGSLYLAQQVTRLAQAGDIAEALARLEAVPSERRTFEWRWLRSVLEEREDIGLFALRVPVPPSRIAFVGSGHVLAALTPTRELFAWRMSGGGTVQTWSASLPPPGDVDDDPSRALLPSGTVGQTWMAALPSGTDLAVAVDGEPLFVARLEREMLQIGTLALGQARPVRRAWGVAVARDAPLLATGGAAEDPPQVVEFTTGRTVQLSDGPISAQFGTDGRERTVYTRPALNAHGTVVLLNCARMGSETTIVAAWDTGSGDVIRTWDLPARGVGAPDPVATAALNQADEFLVALGPRFFRWNPSTGPPLPVGPPWASSLTALAVTGDGTRLITGDDRGTVALWDAERLIPILTLCSAGAPVTAIDVASDSRHVAVASEGSYAITVCRLIDELENEQAENGQRD